MRRRHFHLVLAVSLGIGQVAQAERVEITLTEDLDGILNSYCLDIAGGNRNVDPENGLQAHTCYSYQGALGTDQIFETERFADGVLYMPEYEVCAEMIGISEGAKITLAACTGDDLQSIAMRDDGTVGPVADASLCFTAAQDSRFGRGSQHQIKDLTLETCGGDAAPFQTWRTRTTDD